MYVESVYSVFQVIYDAFVSAYITYSVQVSILKKKNVGKNLKSTSAFLSKVRNRIFMVNEMKEGEEEVLQSFPSVAAPVEITFI